MRITGNEDVAPPVFVYLLSLEFSHARTADSSWARVNRRALPAWMVLREFWASAIIQTDFCIKNVPQIGNKEFYDVLSCVFCGDVHGGNRS